MVLLKLLSKNGIFALVLRLFQIYVRNKMYERNCRAHPSPRPARCCRLCFPLPPKIFAHASRSFARQPGGKDVADFRMVTERGASSRIASAVRRGSGCSLRGTDLREPTWSARPRSLPPDENEPRNPGGKRPRGRLPPLRRLAWWPGLPLLTRIARGDGGAPEDLACKF